MEGQGPPRFAGELTDGQSAAVFAIELTVALGGVEIIAATGALLARWPLAGLRVERLPGGMVHIQHPIAPGAMVTMTSAGGGETLTQVLRQADVRVRGLPEGKKLIHTMAVYAGALVILVAGAYAAIPPLSRALAQRVPIAVEAKLGAGADALFESQLCRDETASAALLGLTERLGGAGAGLTGKSVAIINWQMVNAFTLPGGQILLTRGLLDKAEGPDEVAGVLAHELEHVRQRHVMAHVIRGSILSFGWAVTVGDFSGLFVLDPSTMFSIATQSFSRSDERSADAGALSRLDAAGIARAGFATFFERIAAETAAVPAWLTSHPASAERLAAIRAGGPAAGTTAALSAAQWQQIQSACAGRTPVEDPFRAIFRRKK